jgi:hypothetical protein
VSERAHICNGHCTCPIHGTQLIYWPAGDDHACQDIMCQYGHGMAAFPWPIPPTTRPWPEAHLMHHTNPGP